MKSGKETIAFKIKKKTLKKMIEIEQAVAATLEYFDLIIETFDKATTIVTTQPYVIPRPQAEESPCK